MTADLVALTALEQAHQIRAGNLSPLELVELYLRRIESIDSHLGSYVTVTADRALSQARAATERLAKPIAEGGEDLPPFFGVPIAIKDLAPLEGVRFTLGNAALKQQENTATFDNAIVAYLKRAGFVILGKTATPELGTLPYTEPPGFAPTRNPWNPDYTPGGSSGGAAAALAAGLCPIAQGSDGGGSIRGPAHCCGLVGIKPARGRVSTAPLGYTPGSIATGGPLARTVADAAAFLDGVEGYVPGDPYWLPSPEPSFAAIACQGARGVSPKRIGLLTGFPRIRETHPDCLKPLEETARRLGGLGHRIELIDPDSLEYESLIAPFTVVFRSGIGAAGIPPEALSPMNQWFLSHGDTAADFHKSLWAMQGMARRLVQQLSPFDAVLLPTYLHPTIRVGEWADLAPEDVMARMIEWIFPCPLFNATGQPAIALPVGLDSRGLPVGVQMVGRPADEATIIAIAAQLEATYPWQGAPPFVADLLA
ncbi:MAG: amidase [Cyanobacteria bacterium P01_A01_bin.135]